MMKNGVLHEAAIGLAAFLLALTAATANAQAAGSRQTREFLQAVANSDQFEILEAQTVLSQSRNQKVRDFATRMLEDHQQLAEAVRNAAGRSGLKPPEMVMGADQAQWLGALQGVSGIDFDRLYVKQQKLAHSSALSVEQLYSTSGDDPEIRQWAGSTLPLIASHGAMANQLDSEVGGP